MVFESHHEVVLPPDKGTGIRPGDKEKKAPPGGLPAPREYQREGEARSITRVGCGVDRVGWLSPVRRSAANWAAKRGGRAPTTG